MRSCSLKIQSNTWHTLVFLESRQNCRMQREPPPTSVGFSHSAFFELFSINEKVRMRVMASLIRSSRSESCRIDASHHQNVNHKQKNITTTYQFYPCIDGDRGRIHTFNVMPPMIGYKEHLTWFKSSNMWMAALKTAQKIHNHVMH